MIQYHGYPVEVHEIQTEDGYLFDVHRIPHGRFGDQNMKRGVVILAHGILCSSACWLFLGPGRALRKQFIYIIILLLKIIFVHFSLHIS